MLHLGTLIAVVVVVWQSILDLFRKPIRLLYLVIATLPAIIVTLLLKDFIEHVYRQVPRLRLPADGGVPHGAELLSARVQKAPEGTGGRGAGHGRDAGCCAVSGRFALWLHHRGRAGPERGPAGGCGVFLPDVPPAILGSVVLQGYEVFKEQALPADMPTVIGTACAAVSGFSPSSS